MGFFVVILILKHGIYPWFEKGSLEKKGEDTSSVTASP